MSSMISKDLVSRRLVGSGWSWNKKMPQPGSVLGLCWKYLIEGKTLSQSKEVKNIVGNAVMPKVAES